MNVYRVDWDFALVAYCPMVNAVIIQVGVSFTLMYEPRGLDEMHRRRNKLDEIPLEQRRVMFWREVNLGSQHTSIPPNQSHSKLHVSEFKERWISARSDLILQIYMHHVEKQTPHHSFIRTIQLSN